jgi:SAM-dependent methyltransferase
LLVPLAQSGVDIDGCDISSDMLAACRERADQAGLTVQLYQQPMYELDLPRRYRLITICSSIGLAGSRQGDLETLKRCHAHLEPGGALMINIEAEYTFPDAWLDWLKQKREAMPQPWPEEGKRRVDAGGFVYLSWIRLLSLDPLEQSLVREIRVEKWFDEQLIAREEHTLTERMYFRNELEWLLRLAGFEEILVQGDYSDQEVTADHREMVFVARK